MIPLINQVSIKLSTLGKFWQEEVNTRLFRWNLFFIVFQFVYLFLKYNSLPPQAPLFYSQPWGENQLTPVSSLFLLPSLSVAITLINNVVAAFLLDPHRLFSRLLVIFSFLFSCLSAITLFQIINLIS